MNFIELRFIDAMDKGYLSLYKLIYLDKVDILACDNERLLEDYRQYIRMLKDIKKENDNKKFVIYCMQYFLFEIIRFHGKVSKIYER